MKAYTEKKVAREAKVMTRNEVLLKAIGGKITWVQAAHILSISPRHLRRLKWRFEKYGYDGLRDYRSGRPRRKRIAIKEIKKLLKLREEHYMDFTIKHFHEYATEKHGLSISYNWTRIVLQEAGLAEKAPSRGKYRRQRERRPMTGMLVHIDGSTHQWIPGLPAHDLVWAMDDADGRCLYCRFEPEGTLSTFRALKQILTEKGRFAELYHDCGSHFGRTSKAGERPDEEQNGQVSRALKTLGIRQIFARSPQARGRSERAFGTIQGRLPQELRLEDIKDYEEANKYLKKRFWPGFNRRFTVKPAQQESVFLPMAGIDFDLILSAQYERTVRNDNTVTYNRVTLQLPPSKTRMHFVRCKVLVHEFVNDTLGISFQGSLIARYTQEGELLYPKKKAKKNAA
jgi:transposase